MPATAKQRILDRVARSEPGKAFTPKDFLDLASRGMVDVTLSQLVKDGALRRVRRGLFDIPKKSARIGLLGPDIDEAARALARRHRWTIVPSGAWAANLLGLSTQVPAKIIYLSDGPNKKIEVGSREVQFRHARPQSFITDDPAAALVVQALRHLGKEEVGEAVVKRLRTTLTNTDKRRLVKATRFGPDWIYATAKRIAEDT